MYAIRSYYEFEKKLKMRGVLKPDQIVKLGEIKQQKMMERKKGMDCPYKEGKECPYMDSDGESSWLYNLKLTI